MSDPSSRVWGLWGFGLRSLVVGTSQGFGLAILLEWAVVYML